MLLYHYTNIHAFKSIVENGELWAFHFGYMNDSKEYYWVREITENIITRIQKEQDSEISEFFADALLRVIINQNHVFLFIVSFSTEKDNLGQWRSYSDDAVGICIEFDISENITILPIETIADHWQDTFEFKPPIQLGQWYQLSVVYDREDIIRRYIHDTFEWYSKKYTDTNSTNNYDEMRSVADLIGYYLWVLSMGIKHDAFRDEKEYRIFKNAAINTNKRYDDDFLKNEMNFIASERGMKPYLKLPFSEGIRITGVTVGPKYLGNAWDILDFLQKNEVNIDPSKIERSRIPYQ